MGGLEQILRSATFKQNIKALIPKPLVELLLSIKYAARRLPNRKVFENFTEKKHGIEIGGPSVVFKTALHIYQKVNELDGVNFSQDTVWEGTIRSGKHYNYIRDRRGLQLIAEATDLSVIETGAYDFLLSSNCLEHVANPIKALFEWKRVVRAGGALILVVPSKASNFDHRRQTTSFEHILEDFNKGVDERDLTHLDEIRDLHDLSRDPLAGDRESFARRSLENFKNRTLHHHVFDLALIAQLLVYVGLRILETSETRTDLFALAIKAD